MIQVSFKERSIRLGGKIVGAVQWIPEAGRAPNAQAIITTIGWRTEGRGDRDARTIATIKTPTTSGMMPATAPIAFESVIPADAPPTYDGKLIRIIWEVSVRIDIPWAIDEKHAEPFEVLARIA